MRLILVLAVIASALGCSPRDRQQDEIGRVPATPPRKAAESAPSAGGLPPGWEARTELPEHNRGALFRGREPGSPTRHAPPPARPSGPLVQPPAGPPPPPFAYVGKVARDGEGFAVLAREERVYMVRVGDAVGNGYRVQSIGEKEVVIQNADFGMAQKLPFSASAPNAVLPLQSDIPSPSEAPGQDGPPEGG
jgi:hypothetical protein